MRGLSGVRTKLEPASANHKIQESTEMIFIQKFNPHAHFDVSLKVYTNLRLLLKSRLNAFVSLPLQTFQMIALIITILDSIAPCGAMLSNKIHGFFLYVTHLLIFSKTVHSEMSFQRGKMIRVGFLI